ncbi:MAG: cellulase family glycosylhydrolase [Deltaproteobacteria bacterium]|nr:cellulase family glycosylhydrolase [Deltaproteobacteria bacterium]
MYLKKSFCFILAVFFLHIMSVDNSFAIDRELNNLVKELQALLREEKAAVKNISQARQLNRNSREVSKTDPEKAKELLREAIEILKNNYSGQDEQTLWKNYYRQEVQTGYFTNHNVQKKFTVANLTKNDSDFIYGLQVAALDELDLEKIEEYFQICNDLNMSCIKIGILWDKIVPIDGKPPVWKGYFERPGPIKGNPNVNNFDYDHLAELSQKYNISIFPAFLRSLKPEREISPQKYTEFVYAFVKQYKEKMNIQYVEFHNEPAEANDGTGRGRKWSGTSEQLVQANNAAYEKIKSEYPDIQVGSAGFCTGSGLEAEKYSTPFFKKYFKAHPKFDFFALHDYPKDLSRTQGTKMGNFISAYHIFDTYRQILNNYGYADKPIFITEGHDGQPMKRNQKETWDWTDEDEASVLILESYVHALSNLKKNNIMGKILSGIKTNSGSTAGLIDKRKSIIRRHYYFAKYLIQLLKRYPIYSGHRAGIVNSENYWIEEFRNKNGEKMWIAFAPLNYETIITENLQPAVLKKKMKYPQKLVLNVGDVSEIIISKVSSNKIITKNKKIKNGKVEFNLGKKPVFIQGAGNLEIRNRDYN